MKKIFICALVALACSCTSEQFLDVEKEEEVCEVQKTFFDSEDELMRICEEIISMHIQFDYFCEVLPQNLLKKAEYGIYSLDDAVKIIFLWWENDNTGEVLTEWTVFDSFVELLPKEYLDKYPFYL